jgi:hypothetical protein
MYVCVLPWAKGPAKGSPYNIERQLNACKLGTCQTYGVDMEQNALAFEYQAEYGGARRNCSLSDVINNPNASSVVRVFGPGILEQVLDLPIFQPCSFADDGADSVLIRKNGL